VHEGQEVPTAWRDAPAVTVGPDALNATSGVVEALHQAWSRRTGVAVILLDGFDPAAVRQAPSRPGEPWMLGARFEFLEDRLQFLLWANNYDARAGVPTWWWSRKAERLGARPLSSGPGDVTLPDGTAAWVDGGPRAPLRAADLEACALVHRETVERGQLRPAPEPTAPGGGLAQDQLAAVAHLSGPARIIAPAGSGKTRVLTERLRHLVVGRGWERGVILAVAYNKKAQEELDARCADFSPRTRTLNSLGYAILSDARGGPPRVIDERETRRLVEQLAPVRRHRANTDPIGPYLEALGRVRLGLVDPAVVEDERDDVPGLADLFPRYRSELAAGGVVDFDDQVYGAIEALVADGELRARHQATCRHLLVDEFQDLTPAHVLLLRLLAAPTLDVFGVGDDDQVIYGHAGADPGFLIDFDKLFPGAAAHPLEVNYRCPAPVVDAAASLLSYNRRRVPKTIRAAQPAASGVQLVVQRLTGAAAIDDLVRHVSQWCEAPRGANQIAVLSRVNSLLLAPQVALVAAGIPVSSVLRPEVLERTGLRAALAYLRIATADDNSIDPRDVVEILRRPSRGLPQWFPDRIRRRNRWSLRAMADIATAVPAKDAPKVASLIDDLVALRALGARPGATTAALLRNIRDDIGLGGAMGLLDASRGGEGSSHLDDLEALEQVAALHPDAASFEPWLRSVFSREAEAGGVTLSTVHRVKGMEWDRVALWGVSAGILPHRLAEDIEEERRVLHVAITRCREMVLVLADQGRPSPFLGELDGSAPRTPVATAAGRMTANAPGATRPASVISSQKAPLAERATLPAAQQAAEEALRGWRLSRARADGVPPFVVMSDRTLREIVTVGPTSLVALRQISGIGPAKLDRYGEDVLEVLAEIGSNAN